MCRDVQGCSGMFRGVQGMQGPACKKVETYFPRCRDSFICREDTGPEHLTMEELKAIQAEFLADDLSHSPCLSNVPRDTRHALNMTRDTRHASNVTRHV